MSKKTDLQYIQTACLREVCNQFESRKFEDCYIRHLGVLCDFVIIKSTDDNYSINLYSQFDYNINLRSQLYSPFTNGKVNIVSSKIVNRHLQYRDAFVQAEVCVSLDTQAVSYLYSRFKGKEIGVEPNLEALIRLMKEKTIDMTCFPYVAENLFFNSKRVHKVRESIFAFERMFNQEETSKEECMRKANEIVKSHEEHRNNLLFEPARTYWRVYCILLKMCTIQLSNPARSLDEKMEELCRFMNEKLSLIYFPELILAKRYFERDRRYSFFGKIICGRKDLLDTVKNMAWDLTHLRNLESECSILTKEGADVYIPFFYTFDKRLLEVKGCYELSALAINYNTDERYAFYAHEDEIVKYVERFGSRKEIKKRTKLRKKLNILDLVKECETDLIMFQGD